MKAQNGGAWAGRHDSQQERRQLFDLLDQGVCIVEVLFDTGGGPPDYRFLEANLAFENQTGLAGIAGRTMSEVLPDHGLAWLAACARIARTGVAERFETLTEGLGRSCEVHAFRVGTEAKRRVAVIFTDISDRKRTEESLSRSRAESAAMFRAMTDAAAFADSERRILMVNPAFTALFGYSPDEVRGRTTEFIYTSEQAYQEAGRRRYHAGGPIEAGPYEVEYRRRDGSVFWAESSGAPVQDAQGRTIGFVSVHRDITQRRRAEEQLRRSEESFRRYFENVAVGTAQIDPDGHFVRINDRYCEITLYSREELLAGMGPLDLIHPDDREAESAAFRLYLRGEIPAYTREKRYVRKDGEVAWVHVAAAPVRDETGRMLYSAGVIQDITDRKRAEQSRREIEERYRLLAQTMRQGVVHQDACGTIIAMNPAAEQILGRSREELLGSTPTLEERYTIREDGSVFPGQEHPAVVALRTGQPVHGVIMGVYNPREQTRRWISVEAMPLQRKGEKNPYEVYTIFEDITERKRAEGDLQREKDSYRTFAENLPGIVYRVSMGTERRMHLFNRALPALLGYTEAELTMGNVCSIDPLIVPEDRAAVVAAVNAAIANHRPFEVGYRLRTKTGELRHFSERGRPVYAPDGTCTHLDGVIFDVTASKRAEEEVRAGERRLRLALEAGHMGTWDWTVGSEQAEWSAGHYSLLGYEPGEMAATKEAFRGRIHPEDLPGHDHEMRESMEQHRDYHYEFRSVWPDGSVHWLGASGRFVYREGVAVRMYGVLADIDDVKRARQELEHAKAVAESANRAKDRFIAVLSHELRTPLTPAVAAISLLQSDARLPSDVHADLEMVGRNLDLEVRLIADLLDVSRVMSGKLHIEKHSVDVAAVIRQAAVIVRGDLEAKGQTLSIDSPGEPYTTFGDAARLQQVFWNLLRNAVTFSPERSHIAIRGRVTPADPPDREMLVVEVADQGRGIQPAMLGRLFDPFEQEQGARSFGGLGLGLAICKGIVELHGGTIEANSAGPGRGATFKVFLPLVASPVPSSERAPLAPMKEPRTRALRILLVEDHADSARMMERLLESEGHTVTLAGGVGAALRAASAGTFDVLVSDLSLPDGTGHDLMRRLSSAGGGLRGIALSGHGSPADIGRSADAGFSEHITKPVSLDTLRRALLQVARDPTEPD